MLCKHSAHGGFHSTSQAATHVIGDREDRFNLKTKERSECLRTTFGVVEVEIAGQMKPPSVVRY